MKKLLVKVLAFITLFIPFMSVNAASSYTIKSMGVSGGDIIKSFVENGRLFFGNDIDPAGEQLKVHTRIKYYEESGKKVYVYCLADYHTYAPVDKTVSEKSGEADLGIAYILANGYPNKKIAGSYANEIDEIAINYFTTQVAIWKYLDADINGATGNASGLAVADGKNIFTIADNLVSEAKAYKTANTGKEDSLTLSKAENKFSVSNDNYVSPEMTIGGVSLEKGASVNVSANNGAYVVKSGTTTKITTAKVGDKIQVVVPKSKADSSTTVNLSVDRNKYKLLVFATSATDHNYQDVANVNLTTDKLTASSTFDILKISKMEIAGSEEIAGAHLVLKDKNSSVVDEWDSTTSAHNVIIDLKEGDVYSLTETIAPEGYVLSEETIYFKKVDNKIVATDKDGNVTNTNVDKIIMYNDPSSVSISKQDATTGKELPGATLIVKDSEGNEVDRWVSTDVPHIITNLADGKYTLTELIAPEGYELSSTTIEFEIVNGKATSKVVMLNELTPVPITSANVPVYVLITGGVLLILGLGLVIKRVTKNA